MPSAIYFPLRANAHCLVAGGPVRSVRRRLIIAALMHDQVYIDGGMWLGMSGPTGATEWRFKLGKAGRPETFQTARERGKAEAGGFHMAAKAEGSSGPPRVIIKSDATISWRATFEPFRSELPRAYPWLEFVELDLLSDDKKIVTRMVTQDTRDGILQTLIADEFSRKLVIGSADFALVMGSRMQAAISMDAMHRQVLRARVDRGEATVAYGGDALAILFPAVDDMSWDDVADARKLKGLPELRAVLAEVEEAAWTEAEQGRALEPAIHEAYQRRLHRAAAKLAPSLKGTGVGAAIGGGLSIVTGGLALPVATGIGAAADGVSSVAGRIGYERSWLAAGDHLTNRPVRKPKV